MWLLTLLPFFLQAICIGIDEAYFHVKRGLPRWERIGHPLDTLTTLLCMLYVVFVPYSSKALMIYCALAIFSSIFVTKDEFVHKEHCCAKENWLHALLFTLHPIVLIAAGLIWPISKNGDVFPWIRSLFWAPEKVSLFLRLQCSLMGLFLIYQIVFWNFIWKDKPVLKR